MRQHEFHQPLEDCRPLSEASSFGGDELPGEVRLRDKQRVTYTHNTLANRLVDVISSSVVKQAQQIQQQQQQQRPLTRYLPVRGDGFDLRQHVETAGHQVELCPHVTLTSTSARGYLHKMGSRFKTWNKRWFVFDRTQRTFLYFTDKSETRKRSGAYFQVLSVFCFYFVFPHLVGCRLHLSFSCYCFRLSKKSMSTTCSLYVHPIPS